MAELKDKLVTLEDLKEAYDNTVHLDGDYVIGVKGNSESSYRTGDVNLTPANIGAKAIQSTVNDPAASGTSVTFISNISQNTQGVISPTKRTVTSASQSAAGLMSSADKKKLDGITAGASVTGVKGSSESSYRTGNVNLTAANIGAHPANTTLRVTIDSDYDDGVAANGAVAQILDNNGFIRHQMYGAYISSGSMYTYLAIRKPNGASADSNYIGIGFDSSGNPAYSIEEPAAFRSALGLGNVNNSLSLTAGTASALYTQLNELPVSPTNGAGVTCYMSNPSLLLLTGKTGLSGALYGMITRLASSRYHVLGLYANSYIMYWSFDITSAGAITPSTVYKVQGTAM